MAGYAREVTRMMKQLQRVEYGCDVVRSGKGHWKVSRAGRTVTVSSTPSDGRVIRNIRADLKRYLSITI
jgi:hypothetical protein